MSIKEFLETIVREELEDKPIWMVGVKSGRQVYPVVITGNSVSGFSDQEFDLEHSTLNVLKGKDFLEHFKKFKIKDTLPVLVGEDYEVSEFDNDFDNDEYCFYLDTIW